MQVILIFEEKYGSCIVFEEKYLSKIMREYLRELSSNGESFPKGNTSNGNSIHRHPSWYSLTLPNCHDNSAKSFAKLWLIISPCRVLIDAVWGLISSRTLRIYNFVRIRKAKLSLGNDPVIDVQFCSNNFDK